MSRIWVHNKNQNLKKPKYPHNTFSKFESKKMKIAIIIFLRQPKATLVVLDNFLINILEDDFACYIIITI